MQITTRLAERTRQWGWGWLCLVTVVVAACGPDAAPHPASDLTLGEVRADDASSADPDGGSPPDSRPETTLEDVGPSDATTRPRSFAFTPSEPTAASASARFNLRGTFTSQPASASPLVSPRFLLRP